MTTSNFGWFIHAMLFTVQNMISKKKQKKEATETEDDELGLDEVSEEESD